MATTDEYKALGIKYLNRFLGLDFDGSLETNFYDTPTSIRLEQHIKNLEAEQREARLELLAAKKAHQKVIDERRVRLNKLQLGLTQPVEALLEEVYDRTQRATKLQGADRSYRHELPQAYADIRNFVKNGTYGAHPLEAAGRKWNPVFVTYRLLVSAVNVLHHDQAKKGLNLSNRVDHARQAAWVAYNIPGGALPFIEEQKC